jgi:sucrose-phosphate phosphatase subfamily|tara:strand:- start:26662 stop:28602 length:1941 start_codon:yes stop_codon:yes gene_type:complete
MKIFFASQSFYPHIGGVSTYLLNLARGLIKRGHEVIEVHLRPPNEPSEETVKGIKVFRIPKEPLNEELLKGYSNFKERIYKECHGEGELFQKEPLMTFGYDDYDQINLLIGKQIEELLEENPTEVVDIHDFQLLLIHRNIPRGIPILLRWHIPFIDSISNHLKEFLIKNMKEFDMVVFSSQEYAESAIKAGLPAHKTAIIYPLANTALFKPKRVGNRIRDKYNVPRDYKLIICVQRIDPKSGHIQLIKALPKIIEKYPKVKLMFVGGKSLTSKISQERAKYENEVYDLIKNLNLENNIIFTGSIDYEKVPLYYNSADIAALTSKNEGFGLAVTEAMACGKPIIGTNVTGIALQVEDGVNGYLVGVGDHEKTAEKILQLLTNDELRLKMGKESLRIVKSKFDISKGIDKHYQLYRNLIKEKSDWRLERIKLEDVSAIITDFDRTITDEPGVVNEMILKELDSLNKPLILVTGRSIDYVKNFYKKYPIWDCIIAENGTYIYFPNNQLSWKFTSDKLEEAKRILTNNKFPANIVDGLISVSKLLEPRLMEVLADIKDQLGFKTNVDEVMIIPVGIDKGVSVKLVLNYMGINPKNTIIMGDGENDIDLFTTPGYKIAVANAADRLKMLADEVTKKPSTKGVIEVIEKLRM